MYFLLQVIKLTKNVDSDKYFYSEYGFRFDACLSFSMSNGEFGRNVVTFGVKNSSSTYADNSSNNLTNLIRWIR